jgi:hypothetical protein
MFPHFRISNVALRQHSITSDSHQALASGKFNSGLWLFLSLGQNGNAGAAAANRAFQSKPRCSDRGKGMEFPNILKGSMTNDNIKTELEDSISNPLFSISVPRSKFSKHP